MSDRPVPSLEHSQLELDVATLRAELLSRLAHSATAGTGFGWGFILGGQREGVGPAGPYGYLYAVTPYEVIALTPALVDATRHGSLYLLGCCRAVLEVPASCVAMEWPRHVALPAVALRAVVGCARPGLGGGRLEAVVEHDQAARTPLPLLAGTRPPGWPR